MILILIGIILCVISLYIRFAPQGQLIPSSPEVPSTPTVHWSTEVELQLSIAPLKPPKRGPLLAIKPHIICLVI
jgi:hypothetical protein